jgi:hypothetical protein
MNKRTITDDHRTNYLSNNKSDIFFAENKKEEVKVNHKAMLKEKRTQSSFVPRFKEDSAFNKKIKQFYNKEAENKDIKSSQGYIQKESLALNKHANISGVSHAEVNKLNPSVKEGALGNARRENKFFQNNSTASLFDDTKTSKEVRNDMLVSNIFNDPEKTNFLSKYRTQSHQVKRPKVKDEEQKVQPVRKVREKVVRYILNL